MTRKTPTTTTAMIVREKRGLVPVRASRIASPTVNAVSTATPLSSCTAEMASGCAITQSTWARRAAATLLSSPRTGPRVPLESRTVAVTAALGLLIRRRKSR